MSQKRVRKNMSHIGYKDQDLIAQVLEDGAYSPKILT